MSSKDLDPISLGWVYVRPHYEKGDFQLHVAGNYIEIEKDRIILYEKYVPNQDYLKLIMKILEI